MRGWAIIRFGAALNTKRDRRESVPAISMLFSDLPR
jgi:hypothetical protein